MDQQNVQNRGQSLEALQFYEEHPVEFIEEVIGATLRDWQKDALRDLQKFKFIAIRSGSGVGKTALLSLAALWFLATKPFCRIPTTAPSQHQLFDLLWAEHFKWISRSQYLKNLISWTQTRMAVRGHEPNWYAVARTAQVSPDGTVAEGLQGFHAEDNLLFIVDEASGVADAIFPAMEGALTGPNAYVILAGNPTRRDGFFFDIFNKKKIGGLYRQIHVSCYDVPELVNARYIEMMEAKYGREHPIFQIKVLGEFPSANVMTLIPFSFLEDMQNNIKDKGSKNLPVELGIDVGRTQAASVLFVRQGYNILEHAEKHKPGLATDTNEVCKWIIGFINKYNPTSVKVDAVGIGAGVYDNLRLVYGDMIVPVIGQQTSSKPERYRNLRAQGYWNLREMIPQLYCKSWPDRVIAELGDIRQTDYDKVQIESKKDMLKRAVRSPDYADALMYACLDADLCREVVDRLPPFVFSKLLADANEEMKKESLWGFLGSNLHKTTGWRTKL